MAIAFDVETKKDGYGYNRKKNYLEKGRYYDQNAVEDVIEYIADEEKTRKYYGGFKCGNDPYDAIEDFMDTKEKFNQHEGQQLKHLVVGFDNLVPRKRADYYAQQIAKNCLDKYQNFYGIHIENGRTHIHFAINTVSNIDGERLVETKNVVDKVQNWTDKTI